MCIRDRYETGLPDSYNQRECTPLTACDYNTQFEKQAPTLSGGQYTSDRKCQDLSECNSDEYISVLNTNTTDLQCAPLTNCVPGEYILQNATETSDRTCAPCPEHTFSTKNNSYRCTEQDDIIPTRRTGCTVTEECSADPCPIGTFAPNGSVACKNHTECVVGVTFELTPPTSLYNRVCQEVRQCNSSEYESQPPDYYNDRQCTAFGNCPDGQYAKVKGTATQDVQCALWDSCLAGTYVSQQPNSTHNRKCSPCTSGYTDTVNADQCADWTSCGDQVNGDSRLTGHTSTNAGYCEPCDADTFALTTLSLIHI